MKIEKWIYNGKEVDVPILDDNEIEKDDELKQLDNTLELTEELKNIKDNNE